jgi:hypothetical protein
MLEAEPITPFPPGNPFHHDAIRMGINIGSNVVAMFHQHTHERQDTVIIVNTETGERMLLKFGEQ